MNPHVMPFPAIVFPKSHSSKIVSILMRRTEPVGVESEWAVDDYSEMAFKTIC